jgi:hypothetical protein
MGNMLLVQNIILPVKTFGMKKSLLTLFLAKPRLDAEAIL